MASKSSKKTSGKVSGTKSSKTSSSISSAFPKASAADRASALARANVVERSMGSRLTTASEAEQRATQAGQTISRERSAGNVNYGLPSSELVAKSRIDTATPIDAGEVTSAPKLDIPQPTTQPNYGTDLASAVGTVQEVQPTEMDTAQASFDKITKEYLGGIAPTPNLAKINTKLEKEAGLKAKQQAVSNYQTQLNTIVAKAQADVLRTEGQGRGIPEVIIGGQQAQINKEAAIQALPIQALLASAQDDLQTAEAHVDKMFQIYARDAENSVKDYNEQRKMVYDYLSKKEQAKVDEILGQKKFEQSILGSKIEAQQSYAMQALKDGNTVLFSRLTSIQPPTNVNSPTYKEDLASYEQKVNQAVTKYGGSTGGLPSLTGSNADKYAGALSVILGSTKLTKEQKTTLVNAVNSGADPVAVLKNQAKSVMTGANQTKVESYETAQESLQDISENLQRYYDAGGNTNIFKGNYEKVVNKLGEVSDPELVSLATEIQQGLQIYRNAVSGTAYSVQEGSDIASIFPGITKGQLLNNSIIQGRMNAFESGIDGAYRGILGSTYDDIKVIQPKTPEQTSISDDDAYLQYLQATGQTPEPSVTQPVAPVKTIVDPLGALRTGTPSTGGFFDSFKSVFKF